MPAQSSSLRRVVFAAAVLVAGLLSACATTHNYLDPDGPKYEGRFAEPTATQARADATGTITVVTFNIEYGRKLDGAVALLRSQEHLRDPDILLLQEMDPAGVETMARALRLNYVYYPSTVHPMGKADFGTAVLSPWPLEEPRKLLLPYAAFGTRARRAPTAAVVRIGGWRIGAMSVHLSAPGSIHPEQRVEQVQLIMKALATGTDAVVVGGDFNARSVADAFEAGGYQWLTGTLPGTSRGFGKWWSYDHVFVRGLVPATGGPSAGVVDPAGTSDHRAVWARLALPGPPPGR